MGCRELDINYLENDQEYEVPDTPDRPAAQNYYGSGCMEKKHDFPMASHPGQTDSSEERSRNWVRGRSDRRRLCLHSRRSPSISQNFENASVSTSSLGNSSSSKNAQWSRRPVSGKTADHENMFLLHSQGSEKVTTLHTSQQSPRAQTAVIDLTKQSGPTKVLQKAFPNSASEDRTTKDTTKGPISVDGFSFLRGIDTASMTVQNTTYKGKAKIDDSHSGDDGGKGILGGSQPKAGKSLSLSSHSILSPRVTGKKRLVRNGCIHPLNTAKSKELTENHSGFMNVHNDKEIPVSDCSPSLIRALVAEDANSQRGPGVISHFFPTEEPAAKTMNLSTRQSIPRKEEASGASNDNGDEIRCFEGSSGWRTTHTRTKNVNLPMSYEGQQVSETKDDSCFLNQQNKNRLLRRDNGKGSSDCSSNGYHDDWNAVCSQQGSALTASQAASRHMPDQVSGHRTATRTVIKRQKQGSASSHFAESSTSTSVDSDIVFLRSSGEPSNTRSTRNQNGHGLGIMDSVIEIDDFSPEIRQSGSHNKASSSNVDSNARARQLEADEILARELQEQLYNESPRVGNGERRSVVSNLYQQSQSRTSQTPQIRRGTQARGPSSARLTRFRSRLPRQSPRMPNQGRRLVFPPSMDFDTIMHRINMLEALEAFSEMGMTGNFLQAEGEFNEYDYETLLALDENNHQHGGASVGQINILPESTVQGSNFEEACAICLETPASGDTIRHLPCFHKFHKDCIDPWLRRRSSCPVCKSSVTS